MIKLLQRSVEEGTPLEIIYLSEKETISQRKISILEIKNGYIRAFCFLRQTKRTFKIANILAARQIKPRYKQLG
jgi:predicted DNA-binding transcriptional regulator YafY